jgi:hypothetical protein
MNRIILILFTLAIAFSASSKEKFGVDIGVGLKAGLNFNKVVAREWKDKFSTDPHAGFFVFLNRHRLGVQLEASWTQNNITTDSSFYGLYKQYYNNIMDSLNNGTFRFSTVSIPLLLNIKITQFLWLQGGPQYSANVNVIDRQKILKSGVEVIKSGNFNVVGGLWIQFGGKAPLLRVNAGVRYVSGINNLSNLSTITGSKEEWRNQMIQVHIGINY